jgi:hypothetical protein
LSEHKTYISLAAHLSQIYFQLAKNAMSFKHRLITTLLLLAVISIAAALTLGPPPAQIETTPAQPPSAGSANPLSHLVLQPLSKGLKIGLCFIAIICGFVLIALVCMGVKYLRLFFKSRRERAGVGGSEKIEERGLVGGGA